ncbi:MAG: uridine kinase [Bacteroidales bacterium]
MIVIGIAGGTGSGKTTVVRKVIQSFPENSVVVLSQDNYYRDLGHLPLNERLETNFDEPAAIEWELLIEHLKQLKRGESIEQPTYTYTTCTRNADTIPTEPRKVVIVEGILALTSPELRDMMNIKVFVDADGDDRLIRVINRDIVERGRTVGKVIERYQEVLKPMHMQHIEPTKQFADIIIPQGGHNHVAISILTNYIAKILD